MSDLTRFDDRDSRITYTPISDWFPGGGGSGEFEGTTSGSRSAGAQMRFSFTGSYIAVYGTTSGNITSTATSNTFTLISGKTNISRASTWSASPVRSAIYGTKMYESPKELGYDFHTLVMEVGVHDSET
ncbi:hypothetical protein V5O48_017670 [Marasmius crinis-equi]|uniref:Dirigent protein n=1 Tax=Marasmius crinis-equi TaxID=585013 RepID=A0ABR3ENC6_9AGAR